MTQPSLTLIQGPAGLIETACLLCSFDAPMPARALLIQHPHPLHGGSMGNKVVTTLARAARDLGLATVAFNYRGVGQSEGAWDGGHGEVLDALAVASQMAALGVRQFCLAGFSFGASKSAELVPLLREAHPETEVIDLVQVAPAVENFPIQSGWVANLAPWVIFNEDDEVVSAEAMHQYVNALGVDPVLSDTGGHFFHGQLTRLKSAVTAHWQMAGVA